VVIIPLLVFIDTNVATSVAMASVGFSSVIQNLQILVINPNGPGGPTPQCVYPAQSQPACNQNNPCGFTCVTGFNLCNGACINGLCPSGITSSKRRSHLEQYSIVGQQSLCPNGMEPCGGYKGPTSFECVNTSIALDSCGGCLFPLFGGESTGRDCSIIDGVEKVRCLDYKCSVTTCIADWNVSDDRESCVRLRP